jgi:hypothetical protein
MGSLCRKLGNQIGSGAGFERLGRKTRNEEDSGGREFFFSRVVFAAAWLVVEVLRCASD